MINFIMKHHRRVFLFQVLVVILFFTGCAGESGKQAETNLSPETRATTAKIPLQISTETKLLLNDLNENGDYVNGRNFPSLIKASAVHDQLENNLLIVDIRTN